MWLPSSLEWFFLANLILFYGYITPTIGNAVKNQCLSYWPCRRLISVTYFGYDFDRTDGQWREFRAALGLMLLASLINFIGMYALNTYLQHVNASSEGRKQWRSLFRLCFGLIVLCIQHGYHSLIIIILALIGLIITQQAIHWSPAAHAAAIWCFSITILLLKEAYRVMHMPYFFFLRPLFQHQRYGGLYPWRYPANFLVLRILSYSFDYYWSYHTHQKQMLLRDERATKQSNDETSNDQSVNDVMSMSNYGFIHYASYIVYSPLYMAGPIISFDSFMRYTVQPQQEEKCSVYALRFVGCLLLMEYLTHAYPFFAVVHSGLLPHLTIQQTAIVCYVLLKIMWMKFMILWKFFRLWSMLDGILPPENMTKCMSNNYSLEQFWKGWHTSYNKWIVRYIYKPLGGRQNRIWSVWPIFLFVALWHDIEWKLLLWGLLNSSFYILEVVTKRIAQTSTFLQEQLSPAVKQLVYVLAGATYIIILIIVNLLGYAVGVGGITSILHKIISLDGLITLVLTFYFLSMAVTFMNYLKMKGLSKTA